MTDSGTTPPGGSRPQPSAQDIQEGKVFAILSYALNFISIPFWLVPLIMRNNEYSLYHAKQCLILWLGGLVGYIVAGATVLLCVGPFIGLGVFVCMIVFNILGLMNAMNGKCAPLPVVGPYAEKWFAGISKQ